MTWIQGGAQPAAAKPPGSTPAAVSQNISLGKLTPGGQVIATVHGSNRNAGSTRSGAQQLGITAQFGGRNGNASGIARQSPANSYRVISGQTIANPTGQPVPVASPTPLAPSQPIATFGRVAGTVGGGPVRSSPARAGTAATIKRQPLKKS